MVASQPGYTGTAYLQVLPDIDTLYSMNVITTGPRLDYPLHIATPGTYTLWLRGYPTNAAGDSAYVTLGDQTVEVTGFAPGEWSWANGESATLAITTTGVYTLSLGIREDGLRIDRFLLTTDTTFIPTDFGPAESTRLTGQATISTTIDHTIVYTYDHLYRLTEADHTTGESYAYSYDPVGNRLQQIIDGDTTSYQYDAANRLEQVTMSGQSPVSYTFDDNGNLLATGIMTNTWDTANRLIETTRDGATIEPIYNGVNDRVGQTVGVTTTYFALDVMGLPEVIYTTEGNLYLHLPGVMMAESGTGEVRYLLSDGLGSVRQAADESGDVVAYSEFDPYGNPVQDDSSPYGFTGEWWESDVNLLHLRARWYAPGTGTFLSRDPVESEPPYQYVRGNVVNNVDPNGMNPPHPELPDGPAMPPPPPEGTPTPSNPEPLSSPHLPVFVKSSFRQAGLPSELRDVNGYVEGVVNIAALGPCIIAITGEEIVYDFETAERQKFKYRQANLHEGKFLPLISGVTASLGGSTKSVYGGFLWGFNPGSNVTRDYEGHFIGTSLGLSVSLPMGTILEGFGLGDMTAEARVSKMLGGAAGIGIFDSPSAVFGGPGVRGVVGYYTIGVSAGTGKLKTLPLVPDASYTETFYFPDGAAESFKGQELQMLKELYIGSGSPVGSLPLSLNAPFKSTSGQELKLDIRGAGTAVGANTFVKNGTPIQVGEILNTDF